MLDKTIPYYNIIMKRKAGLPCPEPELPQGFSFVYYSEGNDRAWAEAATSVGEFEDTTEALDYFHRQYGRYLVELESRLIFICNQDGEYIGTANSWWNYTNHERDPSLHWLSVKPGYQGLGLGTALVYKCIQNLIQIEGDKDIFLHTQTWSCIAIGIYLKAGFEFTRTEVFGDYKNDYEKAEPILRDKLKVAF